MKYAIMGFVAAAGYSGVLALSQPAHAHARHASRQDDNWSWHGRIAAGHTVEIHNINGSVSAEPASGDQVEVTAIKREGRRGDAADVRIEAEEHDGDVTICVIYPSRSRADGCNGRGSSGNRDDRNDTEVNFTVRVPRGVVFSGHTVNGGVEAVGLTAAVDVSTVNDGIRIETSGGDVEANTVNGSIVVVATGAGTRPLRMHTTNGSITVTLPHDLSAEVSASTVNGTISTDFPITVDGRMTPRRLRGRIGQGGRILELDTTNGSIRIRSAT
jgi:hypothetical protein